MSWNKTHGFAKRFLGIFLIGFLSFGAIDNSCQASELSDGIVKARQLASAGKYEDAVSLLETVAGTVIGDSDTATAGKLLSDYCNKWVDQAQKQKSKPEQGKVLVRMLFKQAAIAKKMNARQKLLTVMQDVVKDGKNERDLGEFVSLAAKLESFHDDVFADLRQQLLVARLRLFSKTGKYNGPFLDTLIEFQVDAKGNEEDIESDLRKKAADVLLKEVKKIMANDPERAWQLCGLAKKWAGDEPPKELESLRDKATVQIGAWYLDLHDPDMASEWLQAAKESKDADVQKRADRALSRMDAVVSQGKKLAVLPSVIDKDARVKGLPVPYELGGTVTIVNKATLTLDPGVHLKGGKLAFTNGTLLAQGTARNPVILQDIEFWNDQDHPLSVTGTCCVMTRCRHTHTGTIWWGGQRKTLTDSYMQNIPFQVMNGWDEFELTNCTLRYGKFSVRYNDQYSLTAKHFCNMLFEHSTVNAHLVASVTNADLVDCSYYDENWTNSEFRLDKDMVQKTVWMDARSQPIWDMLPSQIKYAADTKARMYFAPSPQPIQRCGASWPCPTFKTRKELDLGHNATTKPAK
jgi:hypothetical protein